MIITITGKRFFGRVDRVPGLFYIATSFIHLFWFPLVPLGTSIVLEGSERVGPGGSTEYLVRKTGFNFKSFLLAYLRAIEYFAIIFSVAGPPLKLAGLLRGLEEPTLSLSYLAPIVAKVGGAGVFLWLSYLLTVPGAQRALALGRALGYPDETVMRQLGIR